LGVGGYLQLPQQPQDGPVQDEQQLHPPGAFAGVGDVVGDVVSDIMTSWMSSDSTVGS
jgi:hypothetical protein